MAHSHANSRPRPAGARRARAVRLGFGCALLLSPAVHAQLGSAVGASIGHDLGEYRAFQHADPRRPRLLQQRPRAPIPDRRVLGLVEIAIAGPRVGTVRVLDERGIERRPRHDILLVPAVTANTLGDTPLVGTVLASGALLSLEQARQVAPRFPADPGAAPAPGAGDASALVRLGPAEQAALPAVPGALDLLPYGLLAPDFAPNGSPVAGLAFALPPGLSPQDDLRAVFAVIDVTPR